MRQGPNGTLWAIAPHLNVRGVVVDTPISRPMVGTTDPYQSAARFSFLSPIPAGDGPRYEGKTVLLMNEDAQSQAESTAAIFKAENGTTFIGSPTAGADGDITSTCLPGNVFISFSGQDIRRPDGGQLQRVGLPPDVEVRPTIAGLRAGRDEVLERALRYLREGR
jgi:C-terminal processing protease CtpA/Prc